MRPSHDTLFICFFKIDECSRFKWMNLAHYVIYTKVCVHKIQSPTTGKVCGDKTRTGVQKLDHQSWSPNLEWKTLSQPPDPAGFPTPTAEHAPTPPLLFVFVVFIAFVVLPIIYVVSLLFAAVVVVLLVLSIEVVVLVVFVVVFIFLFHLHHRHSLQRLFSQTRRRHSVKKRSAGATIAASSPKGKSKPTPGLANLLWRHPL